MSTEGGAASAPSNTSPTNEDAYLVHDGLGLYVVADGASQRAAGEVAARIAVAALEEFIRRERPTESGVLFSTFPSKRSVRQAMRFAMSRIIEASDFEASLQGMTATITMMLADYERAFVCHVGDSRLYLVRDGALHQLTSDHELAVTAETNTADTYADVPVEVFSVDLLETDIFLLCTDGAADVVDDPALLSGIGDLASRVIAAEIIARARLLRPDKDATAVVVRVLEEDDVGWMSTSEPLTAWAYGYSLEYAEVV